MTTIVTCQVDASLEAVLQATPLPDARFVSVNDAVAYLDEARRNGGEIDALVLGPDEKEPLETARCARSYGEFPIIFLVHADDRKDRAEAIRFSAGLGEGVQTLCPEEDDVPTALALAVKQSQQRREYAARMEAEGEKAKGARFVARPAEYLLDRILDFAPVGVVILDDDKRVLALNRRAADLMEISGALPLGRSLEGVLGAEQCATLETYLDTTTSSPAPSPPIVTLATADGGRRALEVTAGQIQGQAGENQLIMFQDVSQREKINALEHEHNLLLSRIAAGDPIPEILASIVHTAGLLHPETLASFSLMDETGKTLRLEVATEMDSRLGKLFKTMAVGVRQGPCGMCAQRGEPVFVADMEALGKGGRFRSEAIQAGLRAGWAQPVKADDGTVLGVFALHFPTTRAPSQHDEEFLKGCAGLVGIALERKRSEDALSEARSKLERRVAERTEELARANADLQKTVAQHEQLTEELELERNLLHSLMDSVPFRIYFKDKESRFLRINKFLKAVHDVSGLEDIIGKTDFDFFKREHAEQAYEDEQHILETGEPILNKEEAETWPDGSLTWASTSKMPLFNSKNEVVGTFGVTRDITQRKRAEQELGYERYLLESLMDNLPEKIFFKDRESRYLRVNKAHAKQVGVADPKDCVGKTDYDYFSKEMSDVARKLEVGIMESGKPVVEHEMEEVTANGRQRWVSVTKLPLYENGVITGTFGMARDITNRKNSDRMVKAERDFVNLIVSRSPAITCGLRPDGATVRFLNPAGERITGYSAHEFRGRNWWDVLYRGDDYEQIKPLLDALKENRDVVDFDTILTTRSGEQRTVSWTVVHRAETGEYTAFGSDITDRKRAEEDLESERNLLRTIIDILPSRIFVKDANSRFMINNIAHLEHLRVKDQGDVRGRKSPEFYQDDQGKRYIEDDQAILENGTAIYNREQYDTAPNGEKRWVLMTKVPLREPHGEIKGIVGMSHDITDRKKTEEDLQRKNEQLESSLVMAREIQMAFLPEGYPTVPEGVPEAESIFGFCHHYLPSATLAGDFFDFFTLSDTEAGVLVCDVMGHGVRAALVTALLRGLVEELMPVAGDPGKFLSEVNRTLVRIFQRIGSPLFVTAFYLVADTEKRTVRYANAGHPKGLLVHREAGEVEALPGPDCPDPALSFLEDYAYTTCESPFNPGDFIFLFTDGIFEAENAHGEQFGEDRLVENLQAHAKKPLRVLFDNLFQDIESFSGTHVFDDDVCMVALEHRHPKSS